MNKITTESLSIIYEYVIKQHDEAIDGLKHANNNVSIKLAVSTGLIVLLTPTYSLLEKMLNSMIPNGLCILLCVIIGLLLISFLLSIKYLLNLMSLKMATPYLSSDNFEHAIKNGKIEEEQLYKMFIINYLQSYDTNNDIEKERNKCNRKFVVCIKCLYIFVVLYLILFSISLYYQQVVYGPLNNKQKPIEVRIMNSDDKLNGQDEKNNESSKNPSTAPSTGQTQPPEAPATNLSGPPNVHVYEKYKGPSETIIVEGEKDTDKK